MQYLVDTNICIAIIRKKSTLATHRLSQQSIGNVAVSTLTVAELYTGVNRSSQPAREQIALEQFLLPFVFLEFDYGSAQTYGTIQAYLEAQGRPIGTFDTLLAAQSLFHNLTMITNNMREFSRIPNLQLADWTQL